MNSSIKLGRYNYPSKISNAINTIKTLKKDFYCSEFPLMIYGENEETSKNTMLSLANTFISSNRGLIFCEAQGDASILYTLYSLAYENNRTDDFCFINCDTTPDDKSKPYTYSVNLITPLIEELSLFKSITDSDFAPVLQALCRCVRDDRQWVTFDDLNKFKELSYITTLFDNPIFKKAHRALTVYLQSIDFFNNSNEAEQEHDCSIYRYEDFLSSIQPYKFLFSDCPDISLDFIIKENKILLIQIPELTRLIGYQEIGELLSYNLFHKDYKDCDVGIFFNVYPFCLQKKHIKSLFKRKTMDKRKIVFSADYYYEGQDETVIKYCNSFILLNIEYSRGDTYHFLNSVGRKIDDIDLYYLNKYKLTELDKLKKGEALYVCCRNKSENYKKIIPLKIIFFTEKDYGSSYKDLKFSKYNGKSLDPLVSYFIKEIKHAIF